MRLHAVYSNPVTVCPERPEKSGGGHWCELITGTIRRSYLSNGMVKRLTIFLVHVIAETANGTTARRSGFELFVETFG